MKFKEGVSIEMSEPEKRVVEAFSILGTSKTTSAVNDIHEDGRYTNKNSELAAK